MATPELDDGTPNVSMLDLQPQRVALEGGKEDGAEREGTADTPRHWTRHRVSDGNVAKHRHRLAKEIMGAAANDPGSFRDRWCRGGEWAHTRPRRC